MSEENVYVGTAMARRAGYMHGGALPVAQVAEWVSLCRWQGLHAATTKSSKTPDMPVIDRG
jgi:alkyl sulfatase BDS1-like metallo-beta-lactamase superfamily hydrolase